MTNIVPLFSEWMEIREGRFVGDDRSRWFLFRCDAGGEEIVCDRANESELRVIAREWALPLAAAA